MHKKSNKKKNSFSTATQKNKKITNSTSPAAHLSLTHSNTFQLPVPVAFQYFCLLFPISFATAQVIVI